MYEHDIEPVSFSAGEDQDSEPAGCSRSPVAIVGIGCRFPGGVSGPDSFWRLLRNGVDAIAEIPSDRIDTALYYDPRPVSPGKMNTRWGGFLEQIDRFDAAFFGVSPREAERMDPQQRLLLEVAWEALEDAGQPADRLAGSMTGVFIGLWLNDYESRLFADPTSVDFYTSTGTGRYSASGRISYTLGLEGPSLTVDTACSSSLVAVHLACQSLRTNECSLALAGGANVILQPHISIAYSQSKMMASDGRCKFGDARADGYVRSEGAGIVVLKPLRSALRDGDPIYAVIRGSAVNNDGRTSGYMATPSREGQERMLRLAYRDAGISPAKVRYVEAHGTGTVAGDPVEVRALGNVLSSGRPPGNTCYIGSVKTNFGHTEGAAGIAGLIKTALVLKHHTVPANLHLGELNSAIPWNDYPFVLPRATACLTTDSEPAVAGVSAFGITGTNAHTVLTGAPRRELAEREAQMPPDITCVLPLSARSPEALASLASAYVLALDEQDAPALYDICYSAALRRSHHEYRLAAAARNRAGMRENLQAFLREFPQIPAGVSAGKVERESSLKTVFVCSGQGSQWAGMGRRLLREEPVFREWLERCEHALRPYVDWSLHEQLHLDPDAPAYRLNEIDVIQPSLFSIQIALGALWRSWGVEPHAVVGHSMGEPAAAFLAGALSLENAARVICTRSLLLRRLSGKGAMAVVALTMAEACEELAGFEGRVSVAVSNSPRSTVLSGDPRALEEILQKLAARNIFCRPVKVDVASHSPQVEVLTGDLLRELDGMEAQATKLPVYSTVTAERIEGTLLDARYWARNLRCPVLFSKAVQKLAADGYTVFIELSPHPVLTAAIDETVHEARQKVHAIPSLEREKDEQVSLRGSAGRLYAIGYPVDWARLFPFPGRVVPLPAYPWQRQRFWLEVQPQQAGNSGTSLREHGAARADWIYELAWKRKALSLDTAEPPAERWLIFADGAGAGAAAATALTARGQDCVLVFAGDSFEAQGSARFSIAPGKADHMRRLLNEVTQGGRRSCRGIVSFWGLESQVAGCEGSLRLVQSLARMEWKTAPPRLWLVTMGAQAVERPDGLSLALEQAPLWGLGRVIALEHPDLWGGLIDLPAAGTAVPALCQELLASDGEDQVALRAERRYVLRLERSRPAATGEPLKVSPDATYLITGGLGNLGFHLAHWLVQRGARHLVLTSRTGLPERFTWAAISRGTETGRRVAAVEALEKNGVTVHVTKADVAVRAEMLELWNELEANRPPVRGIIHAAGELRPRCVAELEPDEFFEALRSKVTGAALLHEFAQARNGVAGALDFFVLFSSGASVWGSKGLAHYAAANHYLDALAQHRAALGLPALSVNWGWWEGAGLVSEELAALFRSIGLKGLPAGGALAALAYLLETKATQKVVADLDWNSFRPIFEARRRRPLLEALAVPVNNAAPNEAVFAETQEEKRHALVQEIEQAPAIERKPLLSRYIRSQVAEILGFRSSESIDTGQGFFKMGMDSLMTVQLRSRLEASLGCSLPPTLAFEYPTVDSLAQFIAGMIVKPEPPAAEPLHAVPEKRADAIEPEREELSEDELVALLATKLEQIK